MAASSTTAIGQASLTYSCLVGVHLRTKRKKTFMNIGLRRCPVPTWSREKRSVRRESSCKATPPNSLEHPTSKDRSITASGFLRVWASELATLQLATLGCFGADPRRAPLICCNLASTVGPPKEFGKENCHASRFKKDSNRFPRGTAARCAMPRGQCYV